AKNYRANVKKLVITRQVEIPLERVNVEVTTENDAYGIVTDIGDTAIKYSEITLKAEAKEGYIFAGWYDGSEESALCRCFFPFTEDEGDTV
ncbi:MAG: hypothetical protein IJD06_05130, partial [Clostridia bacterium]|nr:hypothetical protein [Clostridia bacterium]